MATTAIFDTLAFAKRMKKAGFTEKQAEVQAEAFAEIIDEKIATKADIFNTKTELKSDIQEIRKDIEVLSTKIEWLTKFIGFGVLIVSILAYFKH